MLRIRTLGGLSVHGTAGRAPAGAATQPRRLAVLAYVARAGDRGVTREKLLALLWPDADEDAGRRALSQSLYALRRDLDADELFLGVQELRLNAEAATCDVMEFESALAERNLERAAELYGGPFLDGFRLPGSAEFDRWVDSERRALTQRHLDLLERLARRTADRGDAAGAALWWRRIADLDPLNARVAVELMRALAAAGDSGGALKHARIYEALLAQELDVEPDRQVIELAKRIRAEAATAAATPAVSTRVEVDGSGSSAATPNATASAPPVAVPVAASAEASSTGEAAPPAAEPATVPAADPTSPPAPDTAVSAPVGAVRRSPRSRRAILFAASIAAVAMLTAAVWQFSRGRRGSDITPPVLAVGRIIDYRTNDGRDADAVSDMLATNLARVPGLQVLSSVRVYEVMGQSGDANQSRSAVARAAQRAGASELVEGGLHALADGRLMLDLRRVHLTSGAVRAANRVEATDVYALVTQATTELARGLDHPVGPLDAAEVSTRSLVAYRFYEEGLRHFGRGDYRSAERLFDAAVAEDSAFAMATFYLLMARAHVGVASPPDAWPRLLALAARAPDRERLLIRGSWALALNHPELEAIADTLASRYPAEVDGPYLQGYARNSNTDYLGAIRYMNRVVAMDSLGLSGASARCRGCDAVNHLVFAYISLDSLAAAERVARDYVRRQPKSARAWTNLAVALLAQSRFDEAAEAHRTAMSISPVDVYDRVFTSVTRMMSGDFEEADRLTRSVMRTGTPVDSSEANWTLGISLRYQGRWREALALVREGLNALPASERAGERGRLLRLAEGMALLESGRARDAAAVWDSLVRRKPEWVASGPPTARYYTMQYTLLACALAAAGDTARLAIATDSASAWGKRSTNRRDAHLAEHARGLLLAARSDTAEAVAAFQRAIYSPTTGFTRTNRELATLFLHQRRPADAARVLGAALRSATIETGSLYVSRTELHDLLARAFDDMGRADSAAAHYRYVVKALERSDPEAKSRYEFASQRLAALGGKK